MTNIPHTDCSFTEIWVSPGNWAKAKKSDLSKNWYVQTVFYDPKCIDTHPKGFVYRKKLNRFNTLEERKEAVRLLLDEIPKLFLEQGYNPITKEFMFNIFDDEFLSDMPVNEKTGFSDAVQFAYDNIQKKAAKYTNMDLKYILKHFLLAIDRLRLSSLPISEVRRKHIRAIIDNIERVEGEFSGHKFNKYRTYIQILFEELLEYEAVDCNVVNGIRKRKHERKLPDLLTDEERKRISDHLKEKNVPFWIFLNIYFHSGGRISELLRLKVKDVDLSRQVYRVLVKKGKNYNWVERPIKDISLFFWERLISGCENKEYNVFSRGLVPGESEIDRSQIRRRWNMHVKKPLGINKQFCKIRHLNLTEVSEILNHKEAAKLAGHTSTQMLERHYDIGYSERKNNTIKSVGNSFA